MKKPMTYALRTVAAIAAIAGAGATMALQQYTLANPALIIGAAAAAGLLIALAMARKERRTMPLRACVLRGAVRAVVLAAVLSGGFYTANYAGADTADATAAMGTVVSKYTETRRHTRRVRPGRYAPTGEKYQLYYADIRIEGVARTVKVPLSPKRFSRLRVGAQLPVDVAPGGLGVPVVVAGSIFHSRNE